MSASPPTIILGLLAPNNTPPAPVSAPHCLLPSPPSYLPPSLLYFLPKKARFALDFEIFLMDRVTEFRMQGWSDRTAVCLAVEKTGAIITVAGLIMAVSFVGLLM